MGDKNARTDWMLEKKSNITFLHSLRKRWQDFQWLFIGLLWIIAFGLGYEGLGKYYISNGETRSPFDVFYLTLQLFTMESGSVAPPIPWQLEVARFLAPAVAVYTAIQTLALLFYNELQLFRLRFFKNHVIICGLGCKGLLLAREFCRLGKRVVVVEQCEDNDMLDQCKGEGAIVLIGNATDLDLLRKAGTQRAEYIISVCGDDGTNAEVAVNAHKLAGSNKGKVPTCLIHIVDPELCSLLREQEIRPGKADSFRLEFFNVFERGANLLLNEYPPFDEENISQQCARHLLIIGLGRMGKSLVVNITKRWRTSHLADSEQLPITIIDRKAKDKIESLYLQYPQLEKLCRILPCQMEIDSPEFQRADFLDDSNNNGPVNQVYICFDDDSKGLSTALTLLQQTRGRNIPIIMRMVYGAGLAVLLGDEEGPSSGFETLHSFGLLDKTCTPDLVLGGTHEVLAQAIHEDYVLQQKKEGHTLEGNPSMVTWNELPEYLKESNRRQADHISEKLKSVNCQIALMTDWDAELFEFEEREIEQLAIMEHERWMQERIEDGWKYSLEPKNEKKKTNPCLTSWDELPDEEKEKDRNTVRNLPSFLVKAGFQICRLE